MEYLVDLPTALYEKAGESEEFTLNHLIMKVLGGFHMKSAEIHQISADFERPLARNGKPNVFPYLLELIYHLIK